LLRLGLQRGARPRVDGFSVTGLLHASEFSLGRIARLKSCFELGPGGSSIRPRLYQLLEQICANPVEPGDFVLWRCDSACG
jgi:hypothetical protein